MIVEGASFVCIVLITKWPVIAALTAISAVSVSLISPIIIMSGSCLNMERSPAAKVKPAFALVWTWLIPCNLYSTGSSTVIMFFLISFKLLNTVYKVVDLPLPVGPVTRMIPLGNSKTSSNFLEFSSVKPSCALVLIELFLSRILITTFSPYTVGSIEIRRSRYKSSTLISILPSWGILFSAIFNSDIILILVTKAECMSIDGAIISIRWPSILYLTLTIVSYGSMWISLAPYLRACLNFVSTKRTTGALLESVERSNAKSSTSILSAPFIKSCAACSAIFLP